MGPGNTSAKAAGSGPPIVRTPAAIAVSDPRKSAIARRIRNSKSSIALEAGKLDNVPDNKTSFEGI